MNTKTTPKTDPKADTPEAKNTESEMVRVICHVASGKRRGGRRWEGGENQVPLSEVTEAMAAALSSDAQFTVIQSGG